MKKIQLLRGLILIVFFGCILAPKVNGTEPPAVMSAVAPIYPPIARAAQITGEFFVDIIIDRNGKVISAIAVNPHKLLKEAVEDAARRWTFAPDPHGRRERMARLTFKFVILPEKTSAVEATSICYPYYYKIEVRSIDVNVSTPSQ